MVVDKSKKIATSQRHVGMWWWSGWVSAQIDSRNKKEGGVVYSIQKIILTENITIAKWV